MSICMALPVDYSTSSISAYLAVALKISDTPSFSFDEVGLLDSLKSTTAKHSGRQHVVLLEHHFIQTAPTFVSL